MASLSTSNLTAESLGNEVVTLVVGAEKKVFTVHKKLLCDRSAFFSKGFNGQFKEAAEGRMELPNDTSAAFECFLTWLYWDKTPPLPARLSSAACDGNLAFPISPTAEDIRSFAMTMLYPAYVLAEKFCLHDMQNRFMNAIQDVHAQVCTLPDAKEIQFIYENTQENSKLRLYCATAVAYSLARCADLGQVKDFADLCATIPDFALDLLQVHQTQGNFIYDVNNPCDPRIRSKLNNQALTTKFIACHFHIHDRQLGFCSYSSTNSTAGDFDDDCASDTAATIELRGPATSQYSLRPPHI